MEIPILMYHHIRPDVEGTVNEFVVRPEAFEAQVKYLSRKGYRAASVEEAARRARGTWGAGGADPAARLAISDRVCVLTFDDGYQDVWEHAVPILDRYGFVGTVFAIASHLGGVNAWSSGEDRLMNADQLKTLWRKGWTIGSHTCSHPHLPTLPEERQKMELMESKKLLETVIGETVNTFAYPYNEWDRVTRRLVWETGYDFGCAISCPERSVFEDPYAVRRVFVKRSDSLLSFKRKVSKWYLRYRGLMKH